MALVAAAMVAALGSPRPAEALTCGITAERPPNSAELAIAGGWPEGAPYDAVLIGTILARTAEQGDAGTWGETLTVQVDAVLLGEVPLPIAMIYNAPLGASGWTGFVEGGRYLIAAHKDVEYDGHVFDLGTFLCTPNQPVESTERFWELVGLSASPVVPDTAMVAAINPDPRPRPDMTIPFVVFVLAVGLFIAWQLRPRH